MAHQRQLSQKGYCWLIRGKEGNTVEYQGQTLKAGEAADQLETLELLPALMLTLPSKLPTWLFLAKTFIISFVLVCHVTIKAFCI